MSPKSRVDQVKARLESSLKDIAQQAKQAEAHLATLQTMIAKLDKESAKAEVLKLRSKLQSEITKISEDLGFNSEKFRSEIGKARVKVQDTLKNVKSQVQAIAEAERSKRRGRRRSE